MNIGQVSDLSGVSAKKIRYYESIGLLIPAKRSDSGYRVFNQQTVQTLNFIKQARGLGFPIELIRELLELWENKKRTSHQVKELASLHLDLIEKRIVEFNEIKMTLKLLTQSCHGDERPECPILDHLAGQNN